VTDVELAAAAADAAGVTLLELLANDQRTGNALGAAADAAANRTIMDLLRRHRPGDAILSEEAADSCERLTAERVWIVDPLDGTREYAEGRRDWAVHVALTEGGVPCHAAVALPAQGLTFRSDMVPPVPPPARRRVVILVSRSRPPAEAQKVADALGAQIERMGSAGAKAMAVVRGEADIYLHSGGQHEWDSCAPVAVARGAGLHASRIDGSPLMYNRRDPLVPDLIICHPHLAQPALAALNSST